MIITQAPDPDSEKDPKKRRDYIFHVWFYLMLITPLIILYYSTDTPVMSSIIGSWIGIVGPTIILSGIIEIIINVLSRKRPLISINIRFIIIATCWAALFLTGYYYNLSEESNKDALVNNPTYSSGEQSEVEMLLFEVSMELNKQCPQKLNEIVQLDSFSVVEGSIFQYNLSFSLNKEEIIEF